LLLQGSACNKGTRTVCCISKLELLACWACWVPQHACRDSWRPLAMGRTSLQSHLVIRCRLPPAQDEDSRSHAARLAAQGPALSHPGATTAVVVASKASSASPREVVSPPAWARLGRESNNGARQTTAGGWELSMPQADASSRRAMLLNQLQTGSPGGLLLAFHSLRPGGVIGVTSQVWS